MRVLAIAVLLILCLCPFVLSERIIQYDLLVSGEKVPVVYDEYFTLMMPILVTGSVSTKTIYLELPANVDKIVGIMGRGSKVGNCFDYRLRLGSVPTGSEPYTTIVGDQFAVYRVNIPFSPCKKFMEVKPINSTTGGECSLTMKFATYGTCSQMPYVRCYNQIDCNNNLPVTGSASYNPSASIYTVVLFLMLMTVVMKQYFD